MKDRIVEVADGFWNIRGHFRILGLLDVGTQSSLIRLGSGGFALLDCYTLRADVRDTVMRLTDGGAHLEAVINLHPFHTVHVPEVARTFPGAKLYGTARHHAQFPDLQWQPELTETDAFADLFADELELSVPAGVQLVPDNENLHFGSVLAFHPASRVLHVDDTLSWMAFPWGARLVFHPTLGKVLEPRPGASEAFLGWAEALVERCRTVDHICTAHARRMPPTAAPGEIAGWVESALDRVRGTVERHARKFRIPD